MEKQLNKKVPAIRFKGFEEAWERFLLGNLFPITSAARVHKNQWAESGVPFFRTSDVVAAYHKKENNKAYISHELYLELSDKVGRIKKGDVLITGGGSIGIPYLVSTDDPLYFKDADLLWLKIRGTVDSDFLYTFYSSAPFSRYVNSISHIGTIAHYTVEQAKATPIKLPVTKREQTKVGCYFKFLDQALTLHQHKHDKLIMLKQAMLQKMFPQKGAVTPEIRFEGFEGEWEKRKLGDITQQVSNNSLSRDKLNYKSGLARDIHYGDVLVRFGEVLDAQRSDVPFITDDNLVAKLTPSKLQNGDIVMADAAEDSTVGKCTELLNVGESLVFSGLHTIALRPTLDFAPAFLGYFMNSYSYHHQLLPLMQGTKVLSVSKTVLKDTLVLFPASFEEQQKIGNYFQQLDQLIDQHATQLEKLKQIKAACLERMFV